MEWNGTKYTVYGTPEQITKIITDAFRVQNRIEKTGEKFDKFFATHKDFIEAYCPLDKKESYVGELMFLLQGQNSIVIDDINNYDGFDIRPALVERYGALEFEAVREFSLGGSASNRDVFSRKMVDLVGAKHIRASVDSIYMLNRLEGIELDSSSFIEIDNLYIENCSNNIVMPKNLKVKGDFTLIDCLGCITYPESLEVGGDFFVLGCDHGGILPSNLKVTGDCSIACLPYAQPFHNVEVGKSLNIRSMSSLTSIANCIKVHGDLTYDMSLPYNYNLGVPDSAVDGNIDFHCSNGGFIRLKKASEDKKFNLCDTLSFVSSEKKNSNERFTKLESAKPSKKDSVKVIGPKRG